ncbi:hypothetical protein O7606_23970 [Micromonospora sp. WMMD882]|uniref:hypothetical protein n=1 Tax=Micromonospora sp. WMMD882 TaxID=3015151 RepID=UPI00248B2D41|nr:hypothetical protein [Micromonospora sp. WMMD882]WBB79200.1 hypothetical protein O7606_23970 [Micromonospora sp. WMMD882]
MRRASIAVMAALVVSVSACASDTSSPDPTPSPAATTSMPHLKARAGWCYAHNRKPADTYRKVECTDPAAEAKVVQINFAEHRNADDLYQYDCRLDDVDFILDLDAEPPTERSLYGSGRQFACMEITKGPRGQEPGGGNLPITVGDCVKPNGSFSTGPLETQRIIEIRCAKADVDPPTYEVTKIGKGVICPSGTDLSFVITRPGSSGGQTACASEI